MLKLPANKPGKFCCDVHCYKNLVMMLVCYAFKSATRFGPLRIYLRRIIQENKKEFFSPRSKKDFFFVKSTFILCTLYTSAYPQLLILHSNAKLFVAADNWENWKPENPAGNAPWGLLVCDADCSFLSKLMGFAESYNYYV